MGKRKAVIVIGLVEESAGTTKEEIEKEIFEKLSKASLTIPWLKNVKKPKPWKTNIQNSFFLNPKALLNSERNGYSNKF
ncbi:MAG: hypothetical protein OEY24_00120 [Candidatus Bathyarchaeota archaeon]|nr:hypothetical protein [Candidatus Bathyarchaeota archaeon]MDH5494098.1 hypothetical protein [Candidatus Bathyarchaeota archaeon]